MRPTLRPPNRALQYEAGSHTDCPQCAGTGLVTLQQPGKPETASMSRCELCSGFGRVRA